MFLGVDIGFNNNAIVVLDNDLNLVDCVYKNLSRMKSEEEKFAYLYTQFTAALGTHEGLVVYENPVMRGRTGALLAGVVGLLKAASFNTKLKLQAVSPKALKKYITGSGIATKDGMKHHIQKKLDVDYTKLKNDHLIDALCCAYYGHGI